MCVRKNSRWQRLSQGMVAPCWTGTPEVEWYGPQLSMSIACLTVISEDSLFPHQLIRHIDVQIKT